MATGVSGFDPAILHIIVLLSDSALPLGSFAFSSGLESFLAHKRKHSISIASFLPLSLNSLASTCLPFILAAHNHPESIVDLDNDIDASTICEVARRSSITQGRALINIWNKSLCFHVSNQDDEIVVHLNEFISQLKSGDSDAPNAHYAPLWGLMARCLNVDINTSAYLFLFGHSRAVISAAVRSGEIGPYQAQKELADPKLRKIIDALIKEYWHVGISNVSQSVPAIDLWMGRHEKLYSRIFNS